MFRTLFLRIHKLLPLILGAITLASVVLLLVADMLPRALTKMHHDMLGAVPLALIAIAYLLHQTVLRPSPKEVLKTVIVAMAFLFWAANQVWPNPVQATYFNDIAIALFVLDVFLVIIGWPSTVPDEGFAETSRDLEPPLKPNNDE